MPRAELYVGELLMKLMARETGEISKVDFNPQKKAFSALPFPDETFLERRSPESQGVSSAFFHDLISDLAKDRACLMHRMMFLRHGYVVAECAFEPFDMDMWHVSYSMCKSITGMAIGILVGEEKLKPDDKLIDIFSARINPFALFKKTVTVRHLLYMSSGVEFNEAGAVSGNDWRKAFLDSSLKFEPGTKFEYNSMNSYMLSAIVTELTGQSLSDFCRDRIFEPMGIKRFFWESCPQSITKGGWGLFMRIEDMAKVGQLYLQKGMWNGEQIVPKEWVEESTAWQIETGSDDNAHYGYQIWINDDRKGSFSYNGMLGQNVFVYPDIDMVVVTNAGNKDIFQTSTMARMIRDRMKNGIEVSDEPFPENFAELSKLRALCRSLEEASDKGTAIYTGGWNSRRVSMTTGYAGKRKIVATRKSRNYKSQEATGPARSDSLSFEHWMKRLNGAEYMLETSGVGLFPVLMQIVHNNFTDGMKSISFRHEPDGGFYIDIREGEAIFRLRCGFNGKRYVSAINMHSENYRLSVKSVFTRDEYGRIVLRNDISFLEEACMRTLNIYFDEPTAQPSSGQGLHHALKPERIEIRLTETPGSDMLVEALRNMTPESSGFESVVFSKLIKGGMKEALIEAVKNTIQPTIYGRLNNPDLVINEIDNSADMMRAANSDHLSSETDTTYSFNDDVQASTFESEPAYEVESEFTTEAVETIIED